jgi:membrane-bound ClpP family serine protease
MLAPVVCFSIAVLVGGAVLGVLFVVLLSRHRKSSTVELSPLESVASVIEPLQPEGAVLVRGELWRARSLTGERVERGQSNVRVVGARGCLLEVELLGRDAEATGRDVRGGSVEPRPVGMLE